MLARYVSVLVTCGLLFPQVLSAHTVRVPSDEPTIQAGMDSAAGGDTVLVAAGTYSGLGNRDLSFAGEDLVVLSEDGPEWTIIDCQGTWDEPHRGFNVGSGITAVIQGFTVTNGYADGSGGGGISSISSNLVLADCVIQDCEAGTSWEGPLDSACGGGLYCSGGTIDATNCAFTSNECGYDIACSGSGGGVHCAGTSGEFADCEFLGNASHAIGGGAIGGGDLTFRSCLFRGNSAGDGAFGYGGGFSGSSVFRDVTFLRNRSDWSGGGAAGGGGVFKSVTFDRNYAHWDGGGLHVYGATVMNALFTGNSAEEYGGAIRCDGGTFEHVVICGSHAYVTGGGIHCVGDAAFRNVTLVGNEAEFAGAAVWCSSGSPVFSHVVIAFNEAWGEAQAVQGSGDPIFDCSDIYGNEGGDWTGPIADQFGVNGNISEDPIFCDFGNDDFTIDAASPCAPSGNTCGELMGALGVACGMTSVQQSTWGGIKALYR